MPIIEINPVQYGDWYAPDGQLVSDPSLVRPSLGDIEAITREANGFLPATSPLHNLEAAPIDDEFRREGGVERLKQRVIQSFSLARLGGIAGIAAVQVVDDVNDVRRFAMLKAPEGHPDADENGMLWLENPQASPLDEKQYLDSEGCYSCDQVGGFGFRYAGVEVTAENLVKPVQLIDDPKDRTKRSARAAQHEIGTTVDGKKLNDGHLDGVRWPDVQARQVAEGRISELDMVMIHAENLPEYITFAARRRSGEYSLDIHWPTTHSRRQWTLRSAGQLLFAQELPRHRGNQT